MSQPGAGQHHRGEPPVFVMLPSGLAAYEQSQSVSPMAIAVKTLGVAQFLIGIPCVALGVGTLVVTCRYGYIATGIWAGAIVGISGVLGIAAGSSKDQCQLSCYHLMSVIGILLGIALTSLHTLSVIQDLVVCKDIANVCPGFCLTLNSMLFCIGLAVFFLAVTSAIVSIKLNSDVAKSKTKVLPLIPMSVRQRQQGIRAMKAIEDSVDAENVPAGDIRLGDFNYNDDDLKFI